MVYFIIGLSLALGWGLGKLFIDIIYEVTFERLHKSNRYANICGRKTNAEQVNTDRKIGF